MCRPSQVFRTYNASITLDRLLAEGEEAASAEAETVEGRVADYNRANKEVGWHAVRALCMPARRNALSRRRALRWRRAEPVACRAELATCEERLPPRSLPHVETLSWLWVPTRRCPLLSACNCAPHLLRWPSSATISGRCPRRTRTRWRSCRRSWML